MRASAAFRSIFLRVVVGATLAGGAIDAHAEGSLTGVDLYNNCHAPVDNDPAKTFAFLSCISYVEGAASMARVYSLAMKLNDFCVPPGTNSQTVLDAVVGYLATVPAEDENAPAAILIYAALRSSFPCQ